MSPRSTLLAAVALAAAALPASASAATTYVVDPAAAAGCAGTTCKTITDANAKVAAGDTVTIKAGTYREPTIVVTKDDVTFAAAEPGKVTISTSTTTAGAPTLTLGDGSGNGKGTKLRGLGITGPPTGGAPLRVQTTGTLVEAGAVTRTGTADAPAYEVLDTTDGVADGVNTIRTSLVVNLAAPQAAGTAPAVLGGSKTSLVLEDAVVVAGAKSGPGVVFNANGAAPNRVTRGTVVALNPAANGVEVLSAATSSVAKATTLDSVTVVGGSSAAGLRAASAAGNQLQGSSAGTITVTANHVTVAGAGRPFALDAAALGSPGTPALGPIVAVPPGPPVGAVAVKADRSIVHGAAASTVTAAASTSTQNGATAKLTLQDSDVTDTAGGSGAATTTTSGAISRTPDAMLFRAPTTGDYHLRAGAPVIDKGGPQVAGESDKDFEGQPRVNLAASDLGADEYVNANPTAVLKADRTTINQGETVAFDASASGDPDGSIATYAFNFGDGTPTQVQPGPTTSHQFTKVGTYDVRLLTLDAAGGGALTTLRITVLDGTAPAVAITAPKADGSFKLFSKRTVRKALAPKGGRKRTRTTTTTKLRKVLLTGTATDDAGVTFVELALQRVSVTKDKSKVGKTTRVVTGKKGSAAQAGSCTFLDQKAGAFVSRPCGKPVFFTVALKDGAWAFQLKAPIPYRLGSYVLSARATDANGVVSAPVTAAFELR